MRNVTIKREKSFVGCAWTMKVYIEDPQCEELNIGGTPCRKLGELKNGEEKTFAVEEAARKVYVIADRMSKNYSNEFYCLPEGTEDVYLSGKNRYNPLNGNAFRFDGNTNAESMKNRKRSSRKGIVIMLLAVIVGVLVGLLGSAGPLFGGREKTFTAEEMSIVLTGDFREVTLEGYNAIYESREVAVFCLREKFNESLDSAMSLEDYTKLVIAANSLESVEIQKEGNRTYFVYSSTNTESNDSYTYYAFTYKTGDAFWLIQFTALSKDIDQHKDEFHKWANQVTFS